MLGKYVIDKLSKFEGIVDAVVDWANGSTQYSVQPTSGDGKKMLDSNWVDGHYFKEVPEFSVSPKFKPNFKYGNLDKIKSDVSGFKGTVWGTCFHLNGCHRYYVKSSKLSDEGRPVTAWLDEAEIVLVKKYPKPNISSSGLPPGGPSSISTRSLP